MPIYEYRCPSCGHEFELLQALSASGEHECPQCGAVAVRRISPSGFVLKGAGFYVNDYNVKKGGSPEKGASKGSEGESGGKKEAGSDSASAAPAPVSGTAGKTE